MPPGKHLSFVPVLGEQGERMLGVTSTQVLEGNRYHGQFFVDSTVALRLADSERAAAGSI